MLDYCTRLWWETDGESGPWYRKYDVAEQKALEKQLTKIINRIIEHAKKFQLDGPDGCTLSWDIEMKRLLLDAGVVFGMEEHFLAHILESGFLELTRSFIKKAKQFDKDIELKELVQALRNVWIMGCMQLSAAKKVELTPAVFSYSLLYPYTDNFNDSVLHSDTCKKEVSDILEKKIKGFKVVSDNPYEKRLLELLDEIFKQYPREFYPQIYDALENILHFQQKSLLQQNAGISPYECDILAVSFQKGGASVLADALLVHPFLSSKQAEAIFAFGAFLQLADDFQDVKKDMDTAQCTIFTQLYGKWNFDGVIRRLLTFMEKTVSFETFFESETSKQITDMVKRGCFLMILADMARNKRLFGRRFLRDMEKHFPVRFSYWRGALKRIKKEFDKFDIKL